VRRGAGRQDAAMAANRSTTNPAVPDGSRRRPANKRAARFARRLSHDPGRLRRQESTPRAKGAARAVSTDLSVYTPPPRATNSRQSAGRFIRVRLFWRDRDGQDGSGQISHNHGTFGAPPAAVVRGGASQTDSRPSAVTPGLDSPAAPDRAKRWATAPSAPGSAATPGILRHSRRAAPDSLHSCTTASPWPCTGCTTAHRRSRRQR
jgi:hypothetical protein